MCVCVCVCEKATLKLVIVTFLARFLLLERITSPPRVEGTFPIAKEYKLPIASATNLSPKSPRDGAVKHTRALFLSRIDPTHACKPAFLALRLLYMGNNIQLVSRRTGLY